MSTELIDVEMPDGTVVSGVPKGISKSELTRRYAKLGGPPTPPPTPPPAGIPHYIPPGLQADTPSGSPASDQHALADLVGGVPPDVLAHRVLGILGWAVNNLPGGDKRDPNRTQPEFTPEENIGAKIATVGSLAPLVEGAAGLATNGVRAVANKITTPETLATRAEATRASITPTGIPTSKAGVIKSVVNAAKGAKASVQEAAANFMANGQPIYTPGYVARDEATRIASTAGAPREDIIPQEPANIPRPGVPQHIQDQLQAVREAETPEQMYERLRQQRDQQASLPREDFAPDAKGGFERPGPQPFPVPFENGTRLTAPDVNRWLGVSSKEVLRGANPGKQLIEQGLLGATKAATKANVEAALADASQSLDLQLKAATNKGLTIDAQTPVYDGIMGAIKKLGSPRDASFQANLNGLLDDIETKYPDLGRLTPEQTHALKVDLGDSAKWTGAGSDDPINRVKIQIYSDLNNAIKDGVEGIGRTQDRWRNLYIANKATARAIAKDVVGTGTGDVPKVLPRK